ncbi:AcrR family transcriptional regulator [Hamadaea flava]|uniref:Helix-turn-helix domain-containing protein n=1 Tax=Hamadaea flava TaxID=1742688 RepID=A0ABV8LS72_9ACTN|nr:helix-turn-helix domain-containing protein [Hamadaea flava]MCP2328287.1 AcrR family transcriptional regulator [Hamadaea flava]
MSESVSRAERRRRTEERILAAARKSFAEVGYERTTIRSVAGAARVDPALVMQYFGAKEELLLVAIIVGVTMTRGMIELDHLQAATPEQITRLLRPSIEALVGDGA